MAAPVKGSFPVTTSDDWFDRLARLAAGSMSRRDAVGLFAGTTAIAILGSWMRPSRAFGATLSQGTGPGCAGIRTFYRAGCAKPVPKLNYSPKKNGCGPQNGFNPVPQAPLYLADFSPACDGHDVGYGTCNRPKDVTDKKFLDDMKAICAGPGTPLAGLFNAVLLLQCHRNAEIFYTAVSKIGADPYAAGQSEGCDCCDECPGGAGKCGPRGLCCPKDKVCQDGYCCYPCAPGWSICPNPPGVPCSSCCNPATPVCGSATRGGCFN